MPVGVDPACVIKELFPICPEICLLFGIHAYFSGLCSHEATSQHDRNSACWLVSLLFPRRFLVFPSASHPDGGINAALPVSVDPVCVMEETLGLAFTTQSALSHFQKPSPGGEGGPLAVDEVELSRTSYDTLLLQDTSSVTFGASFPSRGSLLVVSLPHNLLYRTRKRLPCAKGGAPKGRRDCRSPAGHGCGAMKNEGIAFSKPRARTNENSEF